MSEACIPHNIISGNTFFQLKRNLNGKGCRPFNSDLRVHIPESTLYTYPDLSIICGEIETTDDNFDTTTNPKVIFEILSKSTRDYDKGRKFTLYRQIKSLEEYVLIDQENIHVEKFTKNEDGSWQLTEFKDLKMSFKMESVQIEIYLTDIYQDTEFKQ